MAEAPTEKSLEILSQELTCSLCRRCYTCPKALACCHYFCKNCLFQRLSVKQSQTITCPECHDTTKLPLEGISSLPDVSFVNRLKELYTRMAMIQREKDAVCESCSSEEAEYICHQCADFMCVECAKSHSRMTKSYPGHRVVLLNQLQEHGARTIPMKPAPPRRCTCATSPEAFCKMFCRDCRQLACDNCIKTEHSGHRHDLAKKCATQSRRSLQQSLFPLRIIAQQFTESLAQIENTKRDITSQGVHVEQTIQSYFNKTISLLEQEKQRLLNQSTEFVQTKLKSLNAQEQTVTRASSAVQNVLEYCKQTTDLVSDEELLLLQKKLQHRVKEECLKHQNQAVQDPCETANIAVQTSQVEDLIQVCREKARIYLFPSNNSHIHMAEVGKRTTHHVTDTSEVLFTPQLSTFTASLISVVDGSSTRAIVTPVGKGLYEVSYTPRVRGRHQLWVKRDGQTISNTPFPVFATIAPDLLGKPVHCMDGLKHPYSAVFDSNSQLFVTQSGGNNIQKFKRSADKVVSESFTTSHQHKCPTGMAIDSDGYVYVVNTSTHTLSKFDRNGELVGEVGREGSDIDEFNHPSGVTIVGERLYVCDRKNDRIKVYTKELKLVETFGSHGSREGEMNWPYDIACGDSDHIYIADSDNHRVQIFDRSGHFLRSFGTSGGEIGSMMRPTGICIGHDGLLYITEYANHRVSVFHRDGRYMGGFGSYGSGSGQLCYPVGVTVDGDGFVYVCDQGNNRIQVF